ncbi:hypothetical protein FRB95_002208 [Tulasnella sp. JGI-2019a]|nr:hypothetical protein FRB95_002208 [Tulasnella sp. JGI-2019a]
MSYNSFTRNTGYNATMQMPMPIPPPIPAPSPASSYHSIQPSQHRPSPVRFSPALPYEPTLPYQAALPIPTSGSAHSRSSSWTSNYMLAPPSPQEVLLAGGGGSSLPVPRHSSESPTWSYVMVAPQRQRRYSQSPQQIQYQQQQQQPQQQRPSPPPQVAYQQAQRERRSPLPPQPPIQLHQPQPLPPPPQLLVPQQSRPLIRPVQRRRTSGRTQSGNRVTQLPNQSLSTTASAATSTTTINSVAATVGSYRPSDTSAVAALRASTAGTPAVRPSSKLPRVSPPSPKEIKSSDFASIVRRENKDDLPQPSLALVPAPARQPRPVPVRKRSKKTGIPKSALHNPNTVSSGRKKSKRRVHFTLPHVDGEPIAVRIRSIFGSHAIHSRTAHFED